MTIKMQDALRRAIKVVGGNEAMAEAIGVTPSDVSHWTRSPANHVLAIEAASDISRHELRPDFYPPED